MNEEKYRFANRFSHNLTVTNWTCQSPISQSVETVVQIYIRGGGGSLKQFEINYCSSLTF